MAWVCTRLCNLQKGCTRLAAASDKVYQLLAHGRWFSLSTPASSTTKTGRHDIAEILLKVVLNPKNQSINQSIYLQTYRHYLISFSWHSNCWWVIYLNGVFLYKYLNSFQLNFTENLYGKSYSKFSFRFDWTKTFLSDVITSSHWPNLKYFSGHTKDYNICICCI